MKLATRNSASRIFSARAYCRMKPCR